MLQQIGKSSVKQTLNVEITLQVKRTQGAKISAFPKHLDCWRSDLSTCTSTCQDTRTLQPAAAGSSRLSRTAAVSADHSFETLASSNLAIDSK